MEAVNAIENGELYYSTEVLELDPKSIKVGWRARKDYGDIKGLAASIKDVGQMQPVVVRKNKKGSYVIVAGLRRTRACKKLGIPVKAIVVSPENEHQTLVMQLTENVKRKDFDKLEVGEGLQRLKVLYEKKHPETRYGAVGGKGKVKKKDLAENNDAADKFVTGAAATLGISERLVYEMLQIADLPEDDKEEIESAKTTRERNTTARKALSKVRKREKEKRLQKRIAERKEEAKEIEDSESEADEPEDEIVTRIITGDCMVAMDNLDPIFDLIFTDPPYGRRRSTIQKTDRTSINEAIAWDIIDIGWVKLAAKLLVNDGSLVTFCPLEAIGDYERAMTQSGLTYKTAIIWHKTNPGAPPHRNAYLPSCEALVWGVKGKKYILDIPDDKERGGSHNFVEGPICLGEERLDHETQKPLWLILYILERHGYEGCNVLDPFCGVGTTLVGCKEKNMHSVGIELEKKFADKAKLRVEAI